MTNIAMENPNHKWRFIAGKNIYKLAIFHGELLNNQRVLDPILKNHKEAMETG
jgi:hypothetical protein